MKLTLSKSQYIKAKQCPLALWYYRNRKDLTPEISEADQARFGAGDEIGELAMQYFPGGVEVVDPYYDIDACLKSTQKYVDEGYNDIYEATAMHPETGAYSRMDILHKVEGSDEWDLVEVKSSTEVKEYHLDDLAFQYYVFTAAGYKINDCFLIHINNQYVRQGDINVQEMFHLEDITHIVLEKQAEVNTLVPSILKELDVKDEPEMDIGIHCFKPHECGYKYHCWEGLPDYSVVNAYPNKKQGFKVAQEIDSFDVNDIPPNKYPGGNKMTDVVCYQKNEPYVEADTLRNFMSDLVYPLYYLDYETINPSIPLYDDTKPFQQVPFQFSLHIQHEPDGELEHHEYLHQEKSDPREGLTNKLVELCAGEGSVIVYNQPFEEGRNKELAEIFPHHADTLLNINSRMIDFMVPFRKRWLYHPDQKGSYSIKYVLPTYTDISYDGMEIANGSEALNRYLAFAQGKVLEEEQGGLFDALLKYCELDTYAMVVVEKVLRERANA